MKLKHWRSMLAILGLLGLLAAPGMAADLREDRDFRLVNPPLAVETKDKIEVTELFWYGCPHCFDFEPVLSAWLKTLPADVSFRRIPAIFPNNKWMPGARLYYTLEAMGLVEQLHRKVFDAIHLERLRLEDDFVLLDWVAKQGVDRRKFREIMMSPAINNRIQKARELSVASGITGVPAVIVQGRYAALTPGSYEDLVKLLDQLIDRARAEAGGRK